MVDLAKVFKVYSTQNGTMSAAFRSQSGKPVPSPGVKHHVSVSGVQTNYCKFNHQVLRKSDVSLTVNEGMDIRGFIKSMKESGLLDGHFTKAILMSMRSKSEI